VANTLAMFLWNGDDRLNKEVFFSRSQGYRKTVTPTVIPTCSKLTPWNLIAIRRYPWVYSHPSSMSSSLRWWKSILFLFVYSTPFARFFFILYDSGILKGPNCLRKPVRACADFGVLARYTAALSFAIPQLHKSHL
jgi:hypothetical protein